MKAALRKMGNSSGVIIPKPLLAQIGAQPGSQVEMSVEKGRLVIVAVKPTARAGWGEASRTIAAAGDEALAWPEFVNDGDDALTW